MFLIVLCFFDGPVAVMTLKAMRVVVKVFHNFDFFDFELIHEVLKLLVFS
jgi:hypothetical protein